MSDNLRSRIAAATGLAPVIRDVVADLVMEIVQPVVVGLRAESDARQALLNDTYAEKCALLEAVRVAWTDAYREKQRHQASEAAAERQRAWLQRRVDTLEKAVRAKHTELINLRGEQT